MLSDLCADCCKRFGFPVIPFVDRDLLGGSEVPSRRRIGQETLGLEKDRGVRRCALVELVKVIDWTVVECRLADISFAAKGETAWPPLALFKALLLAIWYDLSDEKVAEALDDRVSFRRFSGFSGAEAAPERTAFVRFR